MPVFNLLNITSAGLADGSAWAAAWAFPAIILAALIISWAAESAQYRISQGLALAVLALVQTLPEYTIEGALAINAARDPDYLHLMTANFTGALRLLIGLGFPLIFLVMAVSHRTRHGWWPASIRLRRHHAAEVTALIPPALYLIVIYAKASITLIDAAVLTVLYVGYLWMMSLFPAEKEKPIEQLEAIPRLVLQRPRWAGNLLIVGLFVIGGSMLFGFAEPFVHSVVALAVVIGANQYFMMQWVAPLLSEFPEKVSAFHWARRVTSAPMALMNMTSSAINEATLLVALMPVVYSLARHSVQAIPLDPHQQGEILLTLTSALLAVAALADQRFQWFEAVLIFVFWLVGFFGPMLIGSEQIIAQQHQASPLHYALSFTQLGCIGLDVVLIFFGIRRVRMARAFRQSVRRARR